MRLLVVEDEAALRESLAEHLRSVGFVVDATDTGEEGLYFGTEFPADLAIIDLGLPGMSGMELIAKLRDAGAAFPILILTARDRWQDKVEGLEAGADDYVVKPFRLEELMARVNALVRRSEGWSRPIIECGPVLLDTRSQDVAVNGDQVRLTSFEYRILEYLMLHAGKVISKAALTDALYDQDFDRDSNVIEVLIGRLRKKLDPDSDLQPIETLRGRGYRFALERAAEATG